MKKTRVKLDSENSLLDCLTQKAKVKYLCVVALTSNVKNVLF